MSNKQHLEEIKDHEKLLQKLDKFPLSKDKRYDIFRTYPDTVVFAVVKWGWPIKIGLRKTANGGKPCVGHPRRCQGKIAKVEKCERQEGQCGKWALHGKIYCKRHGGGLKLPQEYQRIMITKLSELRIALETAAYEKGEPLSAAQLEKQLNAEKTRLKKELAAVVHYNGLGVNLQKMLDDAKAMPPHEKYSLQAELDIARINMRDCLSLYSEEVVDRKDGKVASMQMRLLIGNLMMKSATMVAEIAAKATTVMERNTALVDHEQLSYILGRVTATLEKHLELFPEEILRDIKADLNDIRLPPRKKVIDNSHLDNAQLIRDAVRTIETTNIKPPTALISETSVSSPNTKENTNGQ